MLVELACIKFPCFWTFGLLSSVVHLILKLPLWYMTTRRKMQSKIQACNLKIEPQTYVMSGATLHVLCTYRSKRKIPYDLENRLDTFGNFSNNYVGNIHLRH